jgi:hypothetical protein
VTLRARWVTLRARSVTLRASWVTLRARWVTLRARWVTLRARWVTLRAHWVTLRARWVTLRAHWVTLRAHWVTLRARWVTLTGYLASCPVGLDFDLDGLVDTPLELTREGIISPPLGQFRLLTMRTEWPTVVLRTQGVCLFRCARSLAHPPSHL